MQILSIISHKGGAAKTSSAVMLAEDLAQRGVKVLLMDADRQSSSSLLLGVDESIGRVTPTGVRRLRYLAGAGWSLQELPARVDELGTHFDVMVVDTPSLDDPLAQTWLSLSSAALLVVPVEPLSLWTLPGAERELAELRASINPELNLLGILPTLFNIDHYKQRRLLQELEDGGKRQVLSPIPWDAKLAKRAAEDQENATPLKETRDAYRAVAEAVIQALRLEPPAQKAAAPLPQFTPAAAAAQARRKEAAEWLSPRTMAWGACAVVLLCLVGFWLVRMFNPPGASGADRGSSVLVRQDRR